MSQDETRFTITPLGGWGEIGMNCMLWSALAEGRASSVLVDCGLMFPEDYHLGVDVVIPRFDHILERREELRGIVLTHGHEDHIGALPWLVPHLDAPIYASPFTLALVEHKLRERGLLDKAQLVPVEPGQTLRLGDFAFTFIPVCHSIIDGYALAVQTPLGKVIHTGDFKIDPDPLDGPSTDLRLFKDFVGDDGALLLLSDSTNIERDGHSLTEREVQDTLRRIVSECAGRIVVTLFSSHIQRIQEVFDCAAECGRKVVVSGRSLMNNIEIAKNLGRLRTHAGLYSDSQMPADLRDEEVVLLVTGSQGEPLSALSRITGGGHKHLAIHAGDTVIMSSRLIPGNTVAVSKLINNLYRLGAEVYYDKVHAIHASGHAHSEELKAMLEAAKPRYFIPVHGEYRHLVKHCRLAQACGVAPENRFILEDGHPISFTPEGPILEEPILAESILVDGKGVGDVGQAVLKERHILGGEGMVIVLLVLDEYTWDILSGPEILSKGFVFEQQFSHILEDAKCIVLDIFENIPKGEADKLADRIRSSLRRFFRRVLERDPVVVPMVTLI